jgi:hypothetical protein
MTKLNLLIHKLNLLILLIIIYKLFKCFINMFLIFANMLGFLNNNFDLYCILVILDWTSIVVY